MPGRVVVVGSSGQIGRAAIRALIADGWDVTSVRRGGSAVPEDWATWDVHDVFADRDDDGALRAATAGADVVVDTVAYDDTHARQLAGLPDIGSLIVISSLAVYADIDGRALGAESDSFPVFPVPITEEQPLIPGGSADYAGRKVLMEHALAEAAQVPVTILRPGAIYGPGCTSPREL